ncbi:MAG: DUF4326 domain-containing protein [Jatrophihabitans sp.]|uniref:DUF4326 domain-containing protein n=1 Tax=Jatrophihabitans sp. TaxID=1932789 RepID=UPI003F7CD475
MTAPARVQLSRAAGWRKPEGAIVVARPSKWGNPFRVVECARRACGVTPGYCLELDRHGFDHQRTGHNLAAARGRAVERYRLYLPVDVSEVLTELHGRDLCCWCPLEDPCHADVLLQIANGALL